MRCSFDKTNKKMKFPLQLFLILHVTQHAYNRTEENQYYETLRKYGYQDTVHIYRSYVHTMQNLYVDLFTH